MDDWKEHKKQCKLIVQTLEVLGNPEELKKQKKPLKKHLSQLVSRLMREASEGEATAQYNLGVCFMNGTGVAKDEGKAVQYYKMAADQGDAQAQAVFGLFAGSPSGD